MQHATNITHDRAAIVAAWMDTSRGHCQSKFVYFAKRQNRISRRLIFLRFSGSI